MNVEQRIGPAPVRAPAREIAEAVVRRRGVDDLVATDVRRLADGSMFATLEFARLWDAVGGRAVAWTLEDAGRTVAAIPGVEFGRGPFTRFMSMPDGCYGGLFVEEERVEPSVAAAALLDAVVSRRYLRTHLFDYYGSLPDDPRFSIRRQNTTLVDISPRWLPDDKKLLSQIRSAERHRIEVQDFDWTRHADKLWHLVELTEGRHGQRPRYSREFFRRLADLARTRERVKWLWCEYAGEPACTHIYLVERDTLQGWQIYFDKKFSFLKPNQFIRFQLCREMSRRGIAQLNLGATPPGAEGLKYYKKRWGGRPRSYRWLHRDAWSMRFRRDLRAE